MKNYEITKIQLQRIKECVEEYTSDPAITTVLSSLSTALDEMNYDIILFACKQIDRWYQEKLGKILANEYVFNKDTHQENSNLIKDIVSDLESCEDDYKELFASVTLPQGALNVTMPVLDNLLNRFHRVAIQLRDRYDDRATLDIDDEYDVQDLLHSLLQLYCDDIRPEEWVPSYAGSASRQDFLLKNERIVIEVKKTRKGLGNKELANELIIDIARYAKHPDCKTLVCFVYDPECRIHNPRGFESDLNKSSEDISVFVYIRPNS